MRLLITFAGMLVVAGVPVRLSALQAGAQPTVFQDADPLSPLDRTVTLALERVSLKAALDAVARQSGVRIAYSRRVVPLDRPVSVQLDAVRVEAALDTLLRGTGVELNPVVAVGYANVRKSDLTGAVSSVSAEEFATKAAPTVTLSSGLQGKAAGVHVIDNSGMPGVGARVRIRGNGSINANSEPLYVVDGLPAEQGSNSTDPKSNPLMSIDP